MIVSSMPTELLAHLAAALPDVGVHLLDADGTASRLGAEHGVTWERRGGARRAAPQDGLGVVEVELPDGGRIATTYRDQDRRRLEPLLRTSLALLGKCEQLEQDMESMNHSSLQLLEQVSMLGETLPRLSAGETDAEIARTGLLACVVAAGVERAVYLRLHEQANRCEVIAHALFDEDGGAQEVPYPLDDFVVADAGLVAEALASIDSVVLRTVPAAGPSLGQPGAPEGLARREVLAVPVTYDTGDRRVRLGAMLLFDKLRTGYEPQDARLGSEEGQVALSFASMLGAVLGARLSAELGKELSMAQAIQAQILPAAPARVPGFDLAGDYRTSGEVGGDYFDYVPMADGRVLVTVADVSGHNLASGMMMVSARATLRTLAQERSDPAAVFTELAASMFRDLTRTERFITAAAVALSPGGRRVDVVNAGHNDLLHYRAATGTITRLSAEDTVLGFLAGTEYCARQVDLEPGDYLVLYTDGITECVDERGRMFGEDRLAAVVARAAAAGRAADVVAAVMAAVDAHQASGRRGDDVTVVAVKALPQQQPGAGTQRGAGETS